MAIDAELAMKFIRHALKLHRNLDEELMACRILLTQIQELKPESNLIGMVEVIRKSDIVQNQMNHKYSEILSSIEQQAATQDALQAFLQLKVSGPVM